MTHPRSHDGHQGPLASPVRRNPSPTRLRRSSSTINTPLLMAPPTTFYGEVRYRIALAFHQTAHFLDWHADGAIFLVRLGLFLVKMASLARPCWPYSINMGIGASLVALAGLDLGMPSGRYKDHDSNGDPRFTRRVWNYRSSFILVALHFAVLWAAHRWAALCPSSHERWAY